MISDNFRQKQFNVESTRKQSKMQSETISNAKFFIVEVCRKNIYLEKRRKKCSLSKLVKLSTKTNPCENTVFLIRIDFSSPVVEVYRFLLSCGYNRLSVFHVQEFLLEKTTSWMWIISKKRGSNRRWLKPLPTCVCSDAKTI